MTAAGQGDQYPATWYVAVDDAPVHSGPGQPFYATQHLAWGTKVEVYRQENDRWVAIRPPEGSFSWVAAEAVESTDDPTLVRVKVDGAATRVGTQFSDDRHVEYVHLEKGEILEVLGSQVTTEEPDRPRTRWLKVAPVAGEYRWMRASDLSPRPPQSSSESPSEPGGAIETASLEMPVEQPPEKVDPAAATPPGAWQSRLDPLDQVHQDTGALAARQASAFSEASRATTAPENESPLLDSHEVLDAQMDEVDLRLSKMVSQPVTLWKLDPLSAEVDRIAGIATGAAQRQHLAQLRSRIERFARLQARYRELMDAARPHGAAPSTDPPPRLLSHVDAVRLANYDQPVTEDATAPGETAPPTAAATPSSPARSQAYDGQGWLMPVFTSRTDVPSFALTDDQGRVLQFVTAAPGLNLRRYQRHEVGILGQQSYLPNLHKPLLTASRIVLLDRHSPR
jgi:hypothetical protein